MKSEILIMTKEDWRNVVNCMQTRAFDKLAHSNTLKEEEDCIQTLAAAYSLMDFYS